LNFSSPNARLQPFSEKEKEFVEFLARWLGNELKLAAERKELREQKTLLSSVIDAVPEAVVMADAERRIVVVNPAVERLFGHRPDQLLNCQTAVLYNALSDYEMNAGNRINPETLSDHDKIPIVCRRRNGTTFDGEVSSVVVRTERGEHIGYLSVIRDVTEANRFERAKDELIATVSHELKTPMTSLYGSLRLLAGSASEIPPSSKKLLDVALRNAESVNHMIGDILDLEKLMAVDNQADFEPSDLGTLLEQAAESVRPYAEERNVSVEFTRSRALTPNLMMHKQRVVRLALNLLSNGIKASPEGGVVNLGLTENGTGFFVRDAGGGIPVDLQPVLFDRFTRAQSYRVNEGSGLGMSIVKAIVDQHLGSIGFETHEGQGTTFLVHFPPAMDVPAEEREV
jgi:PAS domain S-box-containing protein